MTWEEIKTWLLANGWSLHPATSVCLTPATAQFQMACDNGRVLYHPIAHGATMIIHMMSIKMRISIRYSKGTMQNRITVSPKNVLMQGGMPRGMMLWSDPHSPHYHKEWVA